MFDDKLKPPHWKKFWLYEMFSWVEAIKFGRFIIDNDLQDGDNHRVLVIPGFLANDYSTAFLRYFLRKKRFRPHGWEWGTNLGHSDEAERHMLDLLESLYNRDDGRKVTIIGWSLGGIYARELARQRPEMVRQVITLGSPFSKSLKANNAYQAYELLNGESIEVLASERFAHMKEPPPVPMTAIYSKNDGIVWWECCMENEESNTVENIEVTCSHCGMGMNPKTLAIIHDRLLIPEKLWKRYNRL